MQIKPFLKNSIAWLFFILSHSAHAQWNSNSQINNPISIETYDQKGVNIVSDTKHGAIIGWLDYRRDTTRADIYAQRIDKNGYTLWPNNGLGICTNDSNQAAMSMTEDGFGGAIFAWNDWRSGNRDVYAQKVDSSGNILWTSTGQPVAVKPYHQKTPKLIGDGNGGAFITWIDSSNVSWDIYAQHIDASGAKLWAAGGLAICTATGSQTNTRIETDNNGGAIIVWQDKRNGVDYDLYAQNVDAAGNIKWAANGVIVCNKSGTQSGHKVRSDFQGGVYVVWQDKRNGVDYNIYAQRISATGSRLWSTNDVLVCNASGTQNSIDITNENMLDGVIASWKDERKGTTDVDVYAQKIDISGSLKWAVNGIPIASSIFNQQNPNTCGDGTGGAIVSFQDSSSGEWDVKCQRIDSAGNIRWQTGGVIIGNAAYSQTSCVNISDNLGGNILSWQDKRSLVDWDVYANHYSPYWINVGTKSVLGSTWNHSKSFPNPATNSIRFQVPESLMASNKMLTLEISDVSGRILYLEKIKDFENLEINVSSFNDGLYFYKILQNNLSLECGKFLVQK